MYKGTDRGTDRGIGRGMDRGREKEKDIPVLLWFSFSDCPAISYLVALT